MATVEDVRARKKIRSEFSKRLIDITALDLQVHHQVLYIRGVIKPIKGGNPDTRAEMERIKGIILQSGLVKDVIIDCAFRT